MFVTLKKMTVTAILAAFTTGIAYSTVQAEETGGLTVNLQGVLGGGGPLYVSVQKREDFQKDRGTSGGIYKNVKAGNIKYEYTGIPAGEYSVMIWHDIDNDGQFSMDDVTYAPLDGWGASGPELRSAPTFDDVKISIDNTGTELTILMHYPN